MKNFEEHLSGIAEEMQAKKDISDRTQDYTNAAVDLLFSTAKSAADILNRGIDFDIVKILRLDGEIVPLLFTFNDNCSGFVAITPGKYIFFIATNSGVIYTYGLQKNRKQGGNLMKSCIQLLTINYWLSPSSVEYRDSTGALLEPQEIVYHLFKWGAS